MSLLITNRDYNIIRHFETYKFATISQLEKIFFKEQQYSYNIARRRLGAIKEANYIKFHRDIETNKNIYIWNDNKIRPPSYHRMLVLDILAELNYIGLNIEKFDVEKEWMNGKVRSDAFTVFTLNNNEKRRYHFFVEIDLSNNYHNLKKYDVLYESGEVQKYLNKAFFPRVLLITDRNYRDVKLKHTKVISINTKLDMFSSILI